MRELDGCKTQNKIIRKFVISLASL